MEANQKTDRPPEQIVREVSTELGFVSLELASADKHLASYPALQHPLTESYDV